MKVQIVYWSGTGNTKAMADLIEAGAKSAGAEVALSEVSATTPDAALEADVLALGCPSMGAEVLEESEFEPFVQAIEGKVTGQKLALFGSYGWGDGEWMRDWTERMKNAGADLVAESLIVNEMPEGDAVSQCKDFGTAMVK